MTVSDALLWIGGSLAASIIVKATATAGLALIGARLARGSRAAGRHVILASAFAILLALPLVATFAPAIPVAVQTATGAPAGPPRSAPAAAVTRARAAGEAGTAFSSTTAQTWFPVATVITAAWIAGAGLFLLPVILALWQMRIMRRSSVAWPERQAVVDAVAAEIGVRRRVELVRHAAVSGPLTSGVVRPRIVLPADSPTWTPVELHRAILHELEHVRRHDWLVLCLARLVCAGYWFHPLVWAMRRQLELEAERACDDAVVRRAEATDYADQLVALARRISSAPKHRALAMASRADLATRVGAVLDSGQRRGRAGTLWVVIACAASALVVTTMSPLTIVAQQAGDAAQKFEVVSIKPCTTGEILPPAGGGARGGGYGGGRFDTSPETLNVQCMTVEGLVYLAYAAAGKPLLNNVRDPNALPVKGGPDWAHSERWSIEAKAPGPAERRTMLRSMLPALLEDRFQLRQHRETEERPMYAMVVAKDGLKISAMKAGGCIEMANLPPGKRMPDAGTFWCGALTQVGTNARRTISMGGTTLAHFADAISGSSGRYVLDKTGVTDLFNIAITFAPIDAPAGDPDVESIFTVLEKQLGLKLEPTRGPAEYIVLDRVERPKPNRP